MKWFIELHVKGGIPFMSVLTVLLIGILIVFFVTCYALYFKASPKPAKTKNLVLSVIYLGSFAAVFGIFAQGFGIMSALSAIQEAADVSFGLIVSGIKISMFAPLYGVVIFLFSSVLWFILKTRYNSVFKG